MTGKTRPAPFGVRLRELREAAGLSQHALARRAGLAGNAAVSRLEAGTRLPAWPTVCALADALGVGVGAFRAP